MDDEFERDKNIIKAPSMMYEPKEGLGYELFKSMKKHKNRIAQYIVETGEKDTFAALLRRCIRTALKMISEGITQNDLVCLCTDNHINSCVPLIASTFLGVKVASLDPSISVEDTAHLLSQVKPTIIFVVPKAVHLIETSAEISDINYKLVVFGNSDKYQSFTEYLYPNDQEDDFRPVHVSPADIAIVFFSSGTTGLPKGICQNHYALLAQGKNLILNGYVTSVTLFYATVYWISAVVFLIATIQSGTARVIATTFDPSQVWELIDKYKVSLLFLAPVSASQMCRAGRPENITTSSLLCLSTGGGIFSETHVTLLRDLLPGTYICQIYGQTEVAGMLTSFKMNDTKDALRLHYKPSSCGRPINGVWYKVVDMDTEETLGPNQQGELRVQSKLIMNGYYNLDSSDSFDSAGWLRTGDIVYYDEDQCFYVVDRIKEMLKYKSWHIAPVVLENILHTHPSIQRAVVIGIPHEIDGDHAMAVVVLNDREDNVTSDDIKSFVDAQVQDRQKLRAGVKFVNSIPMTPSGKVKRRQLRDMVLAGQI